ncbi:chaperonin 10-like protein [Talaromyces proteolyticus]|uniref:Chaperonin 10-like protein n=1 Tax=Talaromyces proteolyticus TaxID=1131652 RepID=A0AAD4KIV3_9EURO|nr:chaperonin 10-like protein [Talaromyces proteolyticus]KAH8693570.1 chaperonin 10-like protein [Talaromyces proteolyticus]
MAAPTRTAVVQITPGVAHVKKDIPLPDLYDDFIIAETRAIALNQTDNHQINSLAKPGCIIGCDWSGVVTKTGKNVTRFKPGDEVFGICHGGNRNHPEYGAFSTTITTREQATMHKPAHISFEEAASIGVGIGTVGQSMYFVGGLPLPDADENSKAKGTSILINGGSSATGTIAIQLAKLSGFTVHSTCSKSNLELVKSRGADKTYDYATASVHEDILSNVPNGFTYVLDCIGEEETAKFCAPLLSPTGGHYHSVKVPVPDTFKKLRPEDTVKATTSLGYTMLGEDFELMENMVLHVSDAETEFAKQWVELADKLVGQRLIVPHPIDIRDGGLQGVLHGLTELKEGKIRGKKLVYKIES